MCYKIQATEHLHFLKYIFHFMTVVTARFSCLDSSYFYIFMDLCLFWQDETENVSAYHVSYVMFVPFQGIY